MNHIKTATKPRIYPGRPEALTLLLFFITLPYLNSLDCSWHLDDIANILLNTPLHLETLSLQAITNTFFAQPMAPGTLYRPVSCLSLALNWFWGQDDVLGYHVVNIAIHVTTSFFLYLSSLLLLRSPALNNRYKTNEHFIAIYATLLWAVNPVQTQAITYIIQRMASLSAMFTIIGVWCYLKARIDQARGAEVFWYFLCCFFSFLLAVGSKENAIVFPLTLLLFEFFFIQKTTYNVNKIIIFCAVCGFLIFCYILVTVCPDKLHRLFSFYSERDFTLLQRVLTEPRILLWYLSLLFYPSPFRLSIDHNIQLSTSLFSPPATIFALVTLAILLVAPFFLHNKYPILSFAILFYLLNHVVESTVFPLELAFEHRNYLPSLFLFLPIALLIQFLLIKYKDRSLMYNLIVAFSTTLLFLSALGTIERNKTWKTEVSLWTDALSKAPGNARPYMNLAFHYQQMGMLQESFEFYSLSVDKYSPTPWKNKSRAYHAMGNILTITGNYNKAIYFFDKAIALAQENKNDMYSSEATLNKAKAQWFSGNKNSALETTADLIDKYPKNGKFQLLYGEMLIAVENFEDGVKFLDRSLSNTTIKDSNYPIVLLNFSLAYGKLGDYRKASFFLNAAQHFNAPSILTSLCLLENKIRSGKPTKAEHAFQALLSEFSWIELMARLDGTIPEQFTLPISYPLLRQYAATWFPPTDKR